MKQLVYDPAKSGKKMTVVCFVSGSGTNYREIVARDPGHNYLVFTNRPGCAGIAIANENGHDIIELSHVPYLIEARNKYGTGKVPRNCPERIEYDQELSRLIEIHIGREPDLICLAGYDQWLTDWMVDKYYPRILNVHPGDTTKGYDGLHWIPTASAMLAGDQAIRSTLFFVDKGEDTGPVLVQSKPLNIKETVDKLDQEGREGLAEKLQKVTGFATQYDLKTYEQFEGKVDEELFRMIKHLCVNLQNELKVAGDWKIFPFAVHDLIARGRVQVDGRIVYIDGRKMPEHGYRLDEYS